MIAAVLMTGKLYAMESATDMDDFYFQEEERERLQNFIGNGDPVVLVDEIESLKVFGLEVVILSRDEEDEDG